MKLLVIADAHCAVAMGEPARWVDDVVSRHAAAGDDVELIEVTPEGAPVPAARAGPQGVRLHRPPHDAFEATLGAALEKDPDIVHVAASSPLGARVVEILRDLPVLLDVHDFWPICPRDDLLRLPRFRPCGEHFPYSGCSPCAGIARLRPMEERIALALSATTLVCHSSFARARLDAGLRRRIEVVPYGVDTRRFAPALLDSPASGVGSAELAALLERPAPSRVLFLGAPDFARGSHLLLDLLVALRTRVPDVELVVAGARDRRDWSLAFDAEARGMGIRDHVVILGAVSAEELPRLYLTCTLAVVPAVGYVAGGLSLIEAMACGLPIVASPVGAVQDLIVDGDEGLLVDGREIVTFADAMQRLLTDPHARAAMGAAARARVLREHTIEGSIARLDRYYDGMRHRRQQAA